MMGSEARPLIPRKQRKGLRNDVMELVLALNNGWSDYYIKEKLKVNK